MPRKLSGPNWGRALRVAGAAGVAGAIAVGAATAEAQPIEGALDRGCVDRVSAPVFGGIDGDPANYFLMPGGDFERALDWASTGRASIVAEDKPFQLNGPTDTQALSMRSGASVTTPAMCVTAAMPHLRFLALSGRRGRLSVTVRLHNAIGEVTSSSSVTVDGSAHQSWAPTANIDLNTDKLEADTAAYVDVRFKSHGDWQIDDIFVDPFAR